MNPTAVMAATNLAWMKVEDSRVYSTSGDLAKANQSLEAAPALVAGGQ